jgi:hypothetical protein
MRSHLNAAVELRGFCVGIGGEKCCWCCCVGGELPKTWLYVGRRRAETTGKLGGIEWREINSEKTWRERMGGKKWRERKGRKV